jgi:pimeloyl-ACP methyl ester carboxylesterase
VGETISVAWHVVGDDNNGLRQYIFDRELTDVCLIGSSMGGLVGLNYAHRYGGVAHLLLLSPALTYLSGERVGLSLAGWEAGRVGELFHYGFNRPVRLRYDLEVDGRFYTPPTATTGPHHHHSRHRG